MATTSIIAATGVGGLAAAVATVGLCVTVGAGGTPEPAWIALLVIGVVLLVIGFMANFEHQSRLWADQLEAQRQVRRHGWQLSRAVPAPGLSIGKTGLTHPS